MKKRFLLILWFIGIILGPSIADYTSEERNDHSKTTYGEVSAIYGSRENSHAERRRTYESPPYNGYPSTNSPCSLQTGCPLTQDINLNRLQPTNVYSGANSPCSLQTGCPLSQDINQNRPRSNGQTTTIDGQSQTSSDLGGGNRGINNAGTQQDSRFSQQYPQIQGYFPPGQIDPSFARFPPPQQGGPMPNFYPSGQNSYPYSQQQSYGQSPPSGYSQYHGPNANYNQHPSHGTHHNQHHSGGHGYHTWDHTLKENTEYTEVGHHKTGFQGTPNGLGYNNGFGYGGYQRHGY